MTDKAKDTSGPGGAAAGDQEAVSTGNGVGSPYDSPTGELPRLKKSAPPADAATAKLPRTDEELGLGPEDVPSATGGAGKSANADSARGAAAGAAVTGGAAAAAPGVGDPDPAGDQSTAAYSYASIPPASNTPGATNRPLRRRPTETRRGTLDLGLLLLRLVVGATFLYHGLQKLTGWFNGPGLDGTRDMMADGGWDHPTLCATLVTAGEVGGGALLILGLITPLAAGSVLAVILNAWMFKQGMIPGFQYNTGTPTGVELDSILAGTAAVIILTGPGRWSLDRNRGWAVRPTYGSFTVLILAVAAAIGTYWYLHGGNPLTGIGPFD